MPRDDHVKDSLPAYCLGCLDSDDLSLVTGHLAACPACRAELAAYQKVADQLVLAVPRAEPSVDLKRCLQERVRGARRANRAGQAARTWQQSVSRWFQWNRPAWAFASLVLIVVLAAGNILLWQQINRLPAPAESIMGPTINLAGTQAAPQAVGVLVVSRDGDLGTLVVDGLPPLDKTRQYQLWLIRDGQRTSGAVFSVDDRGYGAAVVSSAESLLNYSAFGVTIEPHGGSAGPTGNKVLGGTLQSASSAAHPPRA
jgi:anti-sigma-K factor RskA